MIFCTNCMSARPNDANPCPTCGASSPLLENSYGSGAWGSGTVEPGTAVWGAPSSFSNLPEDNQYAVPQLSFDASPTPYYFQAPEQASPSNELPFGQSATGTQEKPSLLPVPYQGGMSLQRAFPMPGTQMQQPFPMTGMELQQVFQPGALQVMPNRDQMLPALPDEEAPTYVPPMYTKPRAIIPRYRIISGFLSVMIVLLLACSGSIYYAKASGKLAFLQQIYGTSRPPSLQNTPSVQIPNPPDKVDTGPAIKIIPSAATASRIDPKTNIPLQLENTFKVGTIFYVTYSAKPPKVGKVVLKWYMNNIFYRSMESTPLDPKATPTVNGNVQMVYQSPASGSVEIYWDDQLAQRLYFAVR